MLFWLHRKLQSPFALAAKHTLTIHFLCLVFFKQTNFATCLSITVLDTMLFQTDVSCITIILEGGNLYLTESLQACIIYTISLSINRWWSCCAVVILQSSQKPLRCIKLFTHPLLAKKRDYSLSSNLLIVLVLAEYVL